MPWVIFQDRRLRSKVRAVDCFRMMRNGPNGATMLFSIDEDIGARLEEQLTEAEQRIAAAIAQPRKHLSSASSVKTDTDTISLPEASAL